MPTISASILAANHANIIGDLLKIEHEIDWIHVDVMDGSFVRNMSFGPKMIEDLRKYTSLPIDVHLQAFNPELLINDFISAGASMITIQFESCRHPLRIIDQIKKQDCKAAISFSPTTIFDQIKTFIPYVDYINLLTVEPGFGGQRIMKEVFPKILHVSEHIKRVGLNTIITVDGGVNENSIKEVIQHGGQNLVMGTVLFSNGNMRENINRVKTILEVN